MMKVPSTPTIYDAFNARALQPHQVAQTFVPSSHYSQLVRQAHTLIVGPRGSGKTTLLKMLQQPALEAWTHPEADSYRSRIDFTGIFIPTDVSWRDQVRSLGNRRLQEEHSFLFSQAAFTTHILRALVNAIKCRAELFVDDSVTPHRRVDLSPEKERQFTALIASEWKLAVQLPTLLGLKYSLNSRLSAIHELSSRESLLSPDGRTERLSSTEWLHLDFLQSVLTAVELFDDLTTRGKGRWALLFDELELAPTWILERLLQSLRSVDERLLFKLSMSPFSKDLTQLDNSLSAIEGHDYDSITLWYAHKEDGYAFSRALIRAMFDAKGLTGTGVDDALGRSAFETQPDEWVGHGTAYRPGSRLQLRFANMARDDRSFAAYLRYRGISPDFHNAMGGEERAAEIRKITSILVVREAFRISDSKAGGRGQRRLRSRKNPKLYAGARSLFAISEGNPRWLKGIVGQLLAGDSNERVFSPSKQASEILDASHRFRALLRTIPCPPMAGRQPARGLLSVLDRIGEFFFEKIVVDDFQPEPPGSFVVDSRTSPDLMESLGKALNAGAIIFVPEDASSAILSSVRGKRFRLSYLLAPHYQLPLILGKPLSLSTILEKPEGPGLFEGMETDDASDQQN